MLQAGNSTASNFSSYSVLTLSFPGSSLPATGGTYTVVNQNNSPYTAGQVGILVTTDGTSQITYGSTGGNGAQTVSVTVSNGKVSVTGSGIMMDNSLRTSDSAALNFNITQLQ